MRLLATIPVCLASAVGLVAQAPVVVPTEVRAFTQQWCAACHAPPEPDSELDLLTPLSRTLHPSDRELVDALRDQLRGGDMPPEGEPQPPRAAVDAVVAWTDRLLADAVWRPSTGPGQVTMRRLSRFEYDRVVADLFGVITARSARFPPDDLGYGFDNVGSAMSFSTLHLETYAAAAGDVAARAIVVPERPAVRRFEAEEMEGSRGVRMRDGFAVLTTNGDVSKDVQLPSAGVYVIRARVAAQQSGDDVARLQILVDRDVVATVDVGQTLRSPRTVAVRSRISGSSARVAIAFINDAYNPDHPDPTRRDRNLHVDWIEVDGPLDRGAATAPQSWLLAADPGAARPPAERAAPVVAALLTRAWRRPPTDREVERVGGLVLAAVADGQPFEAGVRRAVHAALSSPHFLFRAEPTAAEPGEIAALDGFALATRLSFFLWSSVPDRELGEAARSGALAESDGLVAQARRMLADPRASALSENFAAQWLELRRLAEVSPDPERFGTFSDALRADMRRETELLFESIVREKRGIRTLLDADYTFLNARLAAHYGVDGVVGPHFRRVRVADRTRLGVLGHASILTLTSAPTRTSPVARGKWILENLLDDPPPPPPPGNDSFSADEVGHLATLREKLAVHRADPKCAVCHRKMDAFGLVLEHFDPIGRWRQTEDGIPIDATADLRGRRLSGPADLRALLRDGDDFVRCVLEKLFVYAVGRATQPGDASILDSVVRAMPDDPTVEQLIEQIVRLDAFRRREVR